MNMQTESVSPSGHSAPPRAERAAPPGQVPPTSRLQRCKKLVAIGVAVAAALVATSFVPVDDVVPEALKEAVPAVEAATSTWNDHVDAQPAEAAGRDWRCGGCLKFTSHETWQIAYGPYPWEHDFMHLPLWVDAILIGGWWYYRTVARWANSDGRCLAIGWVGNAFTTRC